jgi:hypothetical protein
VEFRIKLFFSNKTETGWGVDLKSLAKNSAFYSLAIDSMLALTTIFTRITAVWGGTQAGSQSIPTQLHAAQALA